MKQPDRKNSKIVKKNPQNWRGKKKTSNETESSNNKMNWKYTVLSTSLCFSLMKYIVQFTPRLKLMFYMTAGILLTMRIVS